MQSGGCGALSGVRRTCLWQFLNLGPSGWASASSILFPRAQPRIYSLFQIFISLLHALLSTSCTSYCVFIYQFYENFIFTFLYELAPRVFARSELNSRRAWWPENFL